MLQLSSKLAKALLIVILANCTTAIASDRTITIIGGSTCSDWTEAKRAASSESPLDLGWVAVMQRKTWLVGYMSGLNASYNSDKNLLKSVNADIISEWIDRYCLKNPKKSTSDGADQLFLELLKING